jgi:catechol 2,3-dioxygenase-like lactoylglutathione lyase family enzyme
MPRLLSITPSVPVGALDSALAFYCDKLGFRVRHRFGDGGAILVREGIELHLTKLDDETWKTRPDFLSRPVRTGAESFLPGTSSYRIQVDDVHALCQEYRSKGAIISAGEPKQQPWGDIDFAVGDPDGNLLTFFQRASQLS